MAGVAITCLPLMPMSAAAQSLIGDWSGKGEGHVKVTVRPDPSQSGSFRAEIDTTSTAFGGGVVVTGRLGDVAVASGEDSGIGVCRVEFRQLAPDRVRLSEVDGCMPFHGASCGFSADLTRVGTEPKATTRTEERLPAPAGGRGGKVPWAPGCEFLQLNADYAPVDVTSTVSPDGTDCYAFKPTAGTNVLIEVAEGQNIIFSIGDVVDADDSYLLHANGYGYTMAVGQLMRL